MTDLFWEIEDELNTTIINGGGVIILMLIMLVITLIMFLEFTLECKQCGFKFDIPGTMYFNIFRKIKCPYCGV